MIRFKYLILNCTIVITGANQTLQNDEIPVFTITINGNRLVESIIQAKDISTINNILVQSWGSISLSQVQQLESEVLKHFDYISKNTYLCYYQSKNFDMIREIDFIIYTDIYHIVSKTVPNLKDLISDQDYCINIIFYTNIQLVIPNGFNGTKKPHI